VSSAVRPPLTGGQWVGRAWDAVSMYLPIILMAVLALGTYWLARNTPAFTSPEAQRTPTHQPDYFMRGFSVKSFDANGRLKSELLGVEARHYPDTDTLEIDQPRIRSYNDQGALTVATAKRAVANGDGTQVQLIGDAVVTRDGAKQANGSAAPRLAIRGQFLHAFLDTERVKSDQPVVLTRGDDQFTADNLEYDNLGRVLELRGRVHGTLTPGAGP
jgi:lipopolysaccharide export system protein LptC